MRLYSGTSNQFIEDTNTNQIAGKLKDAYFEHFQFNPCEAEINSWRNSLRCMSDVLEHSELRDHGVILEYQLPLSSKRLDFLISGQDTARKDNAVIIELKQWDLTEESDSDNEVITWVGGCKREVLHPSAQVGGYQAYLADTHTAFWEEPDPIALSACAYLHNYYYEPSDPLFANKFKPLMEAYPVFTADHMPKLSSFLKSRLSHGQGAEVLTKIEQSKYRPCKKLMDHVGNVIKGKSEYILLDEQRIVYDKVVACARAGFHDRKKTVLIVKGGPGTGKSVIAINLVADLLLKGYNAHYATGSRAFTETLREIIGTRGSVQFKYFNSYVQAENNAVDVMICDESHRVRKTSNNRFTKVIYRSELPQIGEIINASKVAVFFIDDDQVVRPDEVGSVEYIKMYAENDGCEIFEYELEAQFRCNGSNAFVNWINNTLGIHKTANVLWEENEAFDFKIIDSPHKVEAAIKAKIGEGFTGRVTAGFCWSWSDPNRDGMLVEDVVVGGYKRPWNAKSESKVKLAPGIPKEKLWAYDHKGIHQVGCIYTAQGFEWDYVGIIFGPDLVYDLDSQNWIGQPEHSYDSVVKRSKGRFIDMVKNTYRVLLSRGMKGCYVYFMDKDTERFFKSRISTLSAYREETIVPSAIVIDKKQFVPSIEQNIPGHLEYTEYLPVHSLKAAATQFGKEEHVEEKIGWMKANTKTKLTEDMFVAQVVGKSMETTIPDGSYCIFRPDRGGSRNGKVVLVESMKLTDPETGLKYTVKRYSSEKEFFDDGTWRHKNITLSPDNKSFEAIVLENVPVEEFRVVAEFVEVVN